MPPAVAGASLLVGGHQFSHPEYPVEKLYTLEEQQKGLMPFSRSSSVQRPQLRSADFEDAEAEEVISE